MFFRSFLVLLIVFGLFDDFLTLFPTLMTVGTVGTDYVSFTDHIGPFTDHIGPFTDHIGPFTDHIGPFWSFCDHFWSFFVYLWSFFGLFPQIP